MELKELPLPRLCRLRRQKEPHTDKEYVVEGRLQVALLIPLRRQYTLSSSQLPLKKSFWAPSGHCRPSLLVLIVNGTGTGSR
jgi:hypothetical protein